MLSQGKRTAASFGVILLTYWFYAMAIVPWIEPESRGPARAHATPIEEFSSTDAFKSEIRDLFPSDAWEMGNSKILRSGDASLLFQDYRPNADGTVHIHPCTVVFRRPEREDDQAPLILQAPEGAVLRLNRPLDLKAAQFGRPVEGRLLGQIRIHSPGRDDGAGKLEITTSNVQMDTKQLWTPNDVVAAFDQSRAKGRDLMIQLAPRGRANDAQRLGWAGIQSIELVHLDELYLEIDQEPTKRPRDDAIRTNVPVAITCAGQFRIDFLQNLITFEEQVHLQRLNPDSPPDSLRCERLMLYLVSEKPDQSSPREGEQKLPRLDPHRVVAEGTPATLESPSRNVFIRGQKLYYNLKNRRFRLHSSPTDPTDQVLFRHDAHEIYARELAAEMSVDQSLEQLRAVGPGRFRGLTPGDNGQTLEASWHDSLLIDRTADGHLLTMNEAARIRVDGNQQIEADKIQVWLEATKSANGRGRDAARGFRPQRVAATGRSHAVSVTSPELRAQTKQLDLQFQHPAPRSATKLPPSNRSAGSRSPRARPAPARRVTTVTPRQRRHVTPNQVLEIASERIQLVVRVENKQTSVQQIDLVGAARLKRRSADPDQGEFEMAADTIRVRDQDGRGQHHVVAKGRPVDLRSTKLLLRSAEMQLDFARNLMWIDGAGQMKVMLDRDLQGNLIDQPRPMTIVWKDRMSFDGQQVRFQGHVDVQTDSQRLRSSRMEVQLTDRVDFSQTQSTRLTGQNSMDIEQLLADGNVLLEHREINAQQVMSLTYMHAPQVRINRTSGESFAAGPGRVITHRRGFSGRVTLPGTAPNAAETENDQRVTFVQIDYQQQMTGNLLQRIVAFHGQVQVIYGPVLSWNEVINPDQSLGEDDVLLSCDQLSFAQGGVLPGGARSVNMVADGNTYVEGQTFTARGQRISFEQVKDLLILEGTARSDAVLSHQSRVGAPRSETAARKILYWTQTGNVEVDDARYIDLSNLGL